MKPNGLFFVHLFLIGFGSVYGLITKVIVAEVGRFEILGLVAAGGGLVIVGNALRRGRIRGWMLWTWYAIQLPFVAIQSGRVSGDEVDVVYDIELLPEIFRLGVTLGASNGDVLILQLNALVLAAMFFGIRRHRYDDRMRRGTYDLIRQQQWPEARSKF